MSGSIGALARAVRTSLGHFGGTVRVESLSVRDWASVTFTGARHRLRATLTGAGAVGSAAEFLGTLPDLELTVPGQIVADIALVAEERSDCGCYAALELEALTIEDR